MKAEPVLLAQTDIDVPLDYARRWFYELADHPERYTFNSHAGFTFTQGSFGETGAQFQTEERFAGVRLRLEFELTGVEARRFTFQLQKPLDRIWGYFELDPLDEGTTQLSLGIGSDQAPQRALLRAPLVRGAVQAQIEGEVAHIAESMENLYQPQQEG